MTKCALQVFFSKIALVEYIGVYSDTNKIDWLASIMMNWQANTQVEIS